MLRFNRGTIITGIRRNDLARVIIPLPTLPEQREIVKILREADKLRQLSDQVDEEGDKLGLAFFHDIFGDFGEKSPYRKVKLEKNADVVSGIAKGRNLPKYNTVTVPYLRVANVQAGYLDLSEIKTIDVYPDEVEKYRLQHGDVLLTEGGDFDKLGRGAIWEHDYPNYIHQNHVFRVRLNQEVIWPLFFHYFLQTALANRVQQEPWFNMPHLATDDYITQFATLVRDNLASNLNVYVEFSNEVWNPMFEQHDYIIKQI